MQFVVECCSGHFLFLGSNVSKIFFCLISEIIIIIYIAYKQLRKCVSVSLTGTIVFSTEP